MTRREHFMSYLESTASIQREISFILEAKASEAEKARNWICFMTSSSSFKDQQTLLKETLNMHDQIVELIEGLIKMEQGLGKNLQALLGEEQSDMDFDDSLSDAISSEEEESD